MPISYKTFSEKELLLDFSDFDKREFGFNYKTHFKRRKQFNDKKSLIKFMEITQPLDCFVSVARFGDVRGMKNWLGSDFLIDLDCENWKEINAYARVEADAIQILDILDKKFGIRKDIVVNETGTKGYHIIISDDKIQMLKSGERGEIVNYFTMKYKIKTIDAQCSCDIHRLRRIEGTYNSKSGNLCSRLKTLL